MDDMIKSLGFASNNAVVRVEVYIDGQKMATICSFLEIDDGYLEGCCTSLALWLIFEIVHGNKKRL